jgi:hypothetical protein
MTAHASGPWYREPWPWLLMAGPATVVVAGIATAVVAFRTSDGVVADDYYKQGLAINRVLERGARARLLGVEATAAFDNDANTVSVAVTSHAPALPRLRLTLVHPTRPGVDQSILLTRGADGRYAGRIDASRAANWNLTLEDEATTWRVAGRWHADRPSATLTPVD